ncbi:GNAT family N-acetyltransferase [Devosia sp.]|uniref:GNAT family N-acetyltransferase n=1 Tax=Devosia sp. TaxID=1871048 RepID=UPI003BAB4319
MAIQTLIDDEPQLAMPVRAQHARVSVHLSHNLDEVADAWVALAAADIASPGQDIGFVRTWIGALEIQEADQFFLVAELDGCPLALLPVYRRRVKGVRVLSFFPGDHVGCNAPLVDSARLARMGSVERAALWSALLGPLEGVDMLYLRAIPETIVDGVDIFAELGQSLAAETLYRSVFANWDEANTTQRSKSRRKHDRQQGERLEALGEVSFEEIKAGPESADLLEVLFRQRAARFRDMGIADPFACSVRKFYNATIAAESGVDVRLHVLRLNGEIVAMRYNVAHGDRMFCLISSMSDCLEIQTGSPGKQCLLRVMQTVFDAGFGVFDMGAGFTDEKRHWCNVQTPLRHHYVPLTALGTAAATGHRGTQWLRAKIKANKTLLALAKRLRARLHKNQPAEAGEAH